MSAVGQDQHALVPPYRSLDNARGNDRLATTGRQHIQRSGALSETAIVTAN
jgi:hypothetical protein